MLTGAQPFERESIAEVVDHHALERLRHRHPRVTDCKCRPLSNLLREFPGSRQQAVGRQHFIHNAERKRLMRRNLLPRQEKITSAIRAQDQRPHNMHAIPWHRAVGKCAES